MVFKMEIYSTSQARENLFKLVDLVSTSHAPVYVVGKRNKAVLLSDETYRSLMETIYLTSIPGMKESILEGRKETLENFSTEIDWDDIDDEDK
jgi:antitoxin YefM